MLVHCTAIRSNLCHQSEVEESELHAATSKHVVAAFVCAGLLCVGVIPGLFSEVAPRSRRL